MKLQDNFTKSSFPFVREALKDPILLTQKLIQFPTITPKDEGIKEYISQLLQLVGFKSEIKFFGDGAARTGNIYSRFGNNGRNLCFAGHTDVVPAGDVTKWSVNPFGGEIKDGKLFGRGAVDMKGALACFVVAASKFIQNNPNFNESISLLITGDEEDTGQFGLKEMIKYICSDNKEVIDACIIGEPTSDSSIGDSIRVGRRGSINFVVEFIGIQGHVAYHEMIKNPITMLGNAIVMFKNHKFDEGNEFFDPTNLEFVDASTDNLQKVTNVVPSVARCMFNIRYNNYHTGEKLADFVRNALDMACGKDGYKMTYRISNDSFLYGSNEISKLVKNAIIKEGLQEPGHVSCDCKGGITDGRYIIGYCKNTTELGLRNQMAHKIDEHVLLSELEALERVYYRILCDYFNLQNE